MTLAEKLTAAGLPYNFATEAGTVDCSGLQVTPEQQQQICDIIREHIDPAGYADLQAKRLDLSQLKDEYQATITQLQAIEDAVSPTNAQVIAAVKFLARTLRLVLKLFVRIVQ